MPLDQHIEGRHDEREASVEICPDPVHDLLKVAHDGQHRQDRLDEEAILPLPPLTQFEVGRTNHVNTGREHAGCVAAALFFFFSPFRNLFPFSPA